MLTKAFSFIKQAFNDNFYFSKCGILTSVRLDTFMKVRALEIYLLLL